MPWLFSYGALRRPDVQLATFGRRLNGRLDALPGYELGRVEIQDQEEAAALGQTHYDNVVFNKDSQTRVVGTLFEVTDAELAAADLFEEPAEYQRFVATLASGTQAWVYAYNPHAPTSP